MKRTICPIKHIAKHVAAWMLCLVGFAHIHIAVGQHALPPLYPVSVSHFTIPFEVGESASSIRELELLVSRDRGRRWQAVARQPIETGSFSGKFPFRADSDGEYWFAFRRVPVSGNQAGFNGTVQLRVFVNTQDSDSPIPHLLIQPSKSEPVQSGPVMPPKPERFRPERATQERDSVSPPESRIQASDERASDDRETEGLMLSALTPTDQEVLDTEPPAPETRVPSEDESPLILGPRLPGFELAEAIKERESDLLDDLLNGMRPFLDVQPVLTGPTFPQQTMPVDLAALRSASATPTDSTPAPSVDIAVGGITGIELKPTDNGSQIVVNWNAGQDRWSDAQIDVLRSGTKEGPWIPIAINLPNSGEYWWFLTPEDLKPFHVTVRIRSLHGGIREDVTQYAITIDSEAVSSRLAQFQRL
ncbi:MAG: hypothetical protein FWG73_04160 [Planctomycetaceae bacterium]|nr:hypothetical protein [Planctomycetaceae bacterium]